MSSPRPSPILRLSPTSTSTNSDALPDIRPSAPNVRLSNTTPLENNGLNNLSASTAEDKSTNDNNNIPKEAQKTAHESIRPSTNAQPKSQENVLKHASVNITTPEKPQLMPALYGEPLPRLFSSSKVDSKINQWQPQRYSMGEEKIIQEPFEKRFEAFRSFLFQSGLAPLLTFVLRLLYDKGKHNGQWPDDASTFVRTRMYALTDDEFLMKSKSSSAPPTDELTAQKSSTSEQNFSPTNETTQPVLLHDLEDFDQKVSAAGQRNSNLRLRKLQLISTYKQLCVLTQQRQQSLDKKLVSRPAALNKSGKKRLLHRTHSNKNRQKPADVLLTVNIIDSNAALKKTVQLSTGVVQAKSALVSRPTTLEATWTDKTLPALKIQ